MSWCCQQPRFSGCQRLTHIFHLHNRLMQMMFVEMSCWNGQARVIISRGQRCEMQAASLEQTFKEAGYNKDSNTKFTQRTRIRRQLEIWNKFKRNTCCKNNAVFFFNYSFFLVFYICYQFIFLFIFIFFSKLLHLI